MTTQTDRIRQRLDAVEARAEAANTDEARRPYGDKNIPVVPPERWGALVENYLGGPMGAYCAAHNPTVVLAQVEDYRQQVEDAETVLAKHKSNASRTRCLCGTGCWPCLDVRQAQDRLDRLDALTALMVGEGT